MHLGSPFQGEWNSASQVKGPLWSALWSFVNSWSPTPVEVSVPILMQTLPLGLVVSYTDVCLSGWCCGLFSFVTTDSNLLPIIHNSIIILLMNNNTDASYASCTLCALSHLTLITALMISPRRRYYSSAHLIGEKTKVTQLPFIL